MMDCHETQALLTAFHDGELAAADRARVESHLGGCPECRRLLAEMARADEAAGVPDPGPGYWDRFNARLADRIGREEERPEAAVLRPRRGWMREQLRYFIPAAAAAALVVVVVRYAGRGPVAPTPAPPRAEAVNERPAQDLSGQRMAKAEIGRFAAKDARDAAVPGRPAAESDRAAAAPPAAGMEERAAGAAREERDRPAERSLADGKERMPQDRAAAPAALGAPPSPPLPKDRSEVAASPPAAAVVGETAKAEGKMKKLADAAPRVAEQPRAAVTEPDAGMKVAKDRIAREATAAPAPLSADAARAASPCEEAQALAARGLYAKAESAQRECLARNPSAPAQERGLVFLAELLDRQARFAEADAVIADVHRQFPKSFRLDEYRQQRPMVQKQQAPVPAVR